MIAEILWFLCETAEFSPKSHGAQGSEAGAVCIHCQAHPIQSKSRVKYRRRAFKRLFKVRRCYGIVRIIMSV